MSAILSSEELNDFIAPGVACIKPVETLPLQKLEPDNPFEVTREDLLPQDAAPAQISLTDCLACSGCVTSAEAVLVSLQSHAEVLTALDSAPSVTRSRLQELCCDPDTAQSRDGIKAREDERIFVASVSPQVRASLAATYGIKEREIKSMITQLLSGPQGVETGGKYGNGFSWVVDTNVMRDLALVLAAQEIVDAGFDSPQQPVLTSACPGWICYAEKTHPHILPHLSRLKSPQSLTGIFLKTILSKVLGIKPSQIWHLAIMPCFDKKLEASRQELTDAYWSTSDASDGQQSPTRDVDCVITARELLMLADSRGISFPLLPQERLDLSRRIDFPNKWLHDFLFPKYGSLGKQGPESSTSDGYLYHTLCTVRTRHPGSAIKSERGRNADVVEHSVVQDDKVVFRAARYYGFRNIQNLVRRLKPSAKSRMPSSRLGSGASRSSVGKSAERTYNYVEVMACPGGCTNGGGQIKLSDLGELQGSHRSVNSQRDWLSLVDEAYYSMEECMSEPEDIKSGLTPHGEVVNGISTKRIREAIARWSELTEIPKDKLIYTSYRKVESDVGKPKGRETERVAELASKIGGGW